MTASVGNAPLRAAAQRGRSGGRVVRLVRYPEAGALAGAIVIFVFFAVFAGSKGFLSLTGTGNWLSDASEIGIGALGAGLLMAAGEFDGNVASGQSFQFEFIIAAVVGGVLLTGGYGSVIGVFFGACIYGMADLGVFYTGWDTDWFQAILGGLLLAAVVTNTSFRRKAMTLR